MAQLEIKGIEKAIAKLKKGGDKVAKEVAGETYDVITEMEIWAVEQCPNNFGTLRRSIQPRKVDDYFYYLVANSDHTAPYAAYVEFGTGGKVQIPKEMSAIASSWIGKGIREVNLPAQPYMYPSLVRGRKEYLKRLKAIIKKYDAKS